MKKSVNEMLVKRGPFLTKEKKGKALPKANSAVKAFVDENRRKSIRVFVAGGSRSGKDAIYKKEAFLLGEKIGQMDYHLNFGLSSNGIMGAVAKGVLKSWAMKGRVSEKPVKGITTKEYLSLYENDKVIDEISEVIVAKTLEERKQQLLDADFVIFAPGGVGTLDELVYDCVAMQDGFLSFKPFILFNVNGFFYHLLEYLKEINRKGFSDPMPFIVVDNSFEAGIVFELLFHYYTGRKKSKMALKQVERIIYELPYFIAACAQNPNITVSDVIARNQDVLKNGTENEKMRLMRDIEHAYVKKETERMYSRLERAGNDTVVISGKLLDLKKRKAKRT